MKKAKTKGATTNPRPKQFPKQHLILAGGVAACIMGVMALLPSSEVEARRSEIPMTIDAFNLASDEVENQPAIESPFPDAEEKDPVAEAEAQAEALAAIEREQKLGKWHVSKIQSGDNLSTLFQSRGLGASVVYQVSRTPDFGKQLTDIRPGESLEFRINNDGELTQLRYIKSRLESVFFAKADNGYMAEAIVLEPEVRPAYTSATIENSLFLASQKAGISQRLTMELAGIFGWDIDFVLDIRSGDRFTVLYEEKYLEGDKLGDGNILAATFTNQGKTYTAVRYTDSDGEIGYYTPEGKSMKKAFLRTPVEFTRISSRFNPNRLHPVFKTKRPHRGVDYAAPTNTPIKAAGDGRIKFAGRQNGYGNVVYVEHPNNVVTVYAHANKLKRGLKKGQRVRQGDVIAYVGQTGWATGPHLHYEFRVNGVHRNPMTVKLPDASPIANKEMANFKRQTDTMLVNLKNHDSTILASTQTGILKK